MRAAKLLPLSPALLLCACAAVRVGEPASVGAGLNFATQMWFRGVPRSTRPVLQGEGNVSLPLQRGMLEVEAWGNLQVSESSGDGVFPDGRGGEFTEIDLAMGWSEEVGALAYGLGLIDYNFPNLIQRSTSESYLTGSLAGRGFVQGVQLFYDFHEADGLFASYSVAQNLALQRGWTFDWKAVLGWMDSDQAQLYFGLHESGFSDLSVSGTFSHVWDPVTTFFVGLSLIRVPDGDLREALEVRGAETRGLILSAGVTFNL